MSDLLRCADMQILISWLSCPASGCYEPRLPSLGVAEMALIIQGWKQEGVWEWGPWLYLSASVSNLGHGGPWEWVGIRVYRYFQWNCGLL